MLVLDMDSHTIYTIPRSIAKQTNQLVLNALIDANRAGEQDR